MPSRVGLEATRYLPLDAGGHTVGVRLIDVAEIRHVDVASNSQEPPLTEGQEAGIPGIPLAVLLGMEHNPALEHHLVILATPAGACGLFVEAVKLPRTIEVTHPLPTLLDSTNLLFESVVEEQEQLILLLDAQQVTKQVQRAVLALAGEAPHAT